MKMRNLGCKRVFWDESSANEFLRAKKQRRNTLLDFSGQDDEAQFRQSRSGLSQLPQRVKEETRDHHEDEDEDENENADIHKYENERSRDDAMRKVATQRSHRSGRVLSSGDAQDTTVQEKNIDGGDEETGSQEINKEEDGRS